MGSGLLQSSLIACQFDQAYISSSAMFLSTSSIVCWTPQPISPGTYSLGVSLNGQQYTSCPSGEQNCRIYIYTDPTISGVLPQAVVNSFMSTGLSPNVYTTFSQIPSSLRLDTSGYRCRFWAASDGDRYRLELDYCDRLHSCTKQIVCNSQSCDCSASVCSVLGAGECAQNIQSLFDQRCSAWPPNVQEALVVTATLQNDVMTCNPPPVIAFSSGEPMLLSAYQKNPIRGLTFLQVSWNGQDYPAIEASSSVQQFWYHSKITLVSILPYGVGVSDGPSYVTVVGSNFVNSSSLVVKVGASTILCAVNVLSLNCPPSPTGRIGTVYFVSSQILVILVDPTSIGVGSAKLSVSNNNDNQVRTNIFGRKYETY